MTCQPVNLHTVTFAQEGAMCVFHSFEKNEFKDFFILQTHQLILHIIYDISNEELYVYNLSEKGFCNATHIAVAMTEIAHSTFLRKENM